MADAIRYGCITRRNCMENTSNYGLKRWDGGDRILHTEFNDNWDKIDTALKSSADGVAALQTALASCGNCKIVYGTYTGNGKAGSASPNKLTFDGKPVLVIVQAQSNTTNYDFHLRMIRGCNWAVGDRGNYSYTNSVAWGENFVSWTNDDAETQFNLQNSVYSYIALIPTGA